MSDYISIGKLAVLEGVSTRTIRYYEELGILLPAIITENKYRHYGLNERNKLRLILLLKNLGLSLQEIKDIFEDEHNLGNLFTIKKQYLESEITKLTRMVEFLTSLTNSINQNSNTSTLSLLTKLYLNEGEDLTMINKSNYPIKVISIGGGCNNAINRIIETGNSMDFISIDTDIKSLDNSKAQQKLLIGQNITRNIGTGGNIELGKKAIQENKSNLLESIKGSDMLFIVTCLGGGTGTGASPIIAEIARNHGILTIGVVSRPSVFESDTKRMIANDGITQLKKNLDLLLVIPNDIAATKLDIDTFDIDAYRLIDEYIAHGIISISDIVKSTVSNLDFEDIKYMIRNKGLAYMGIGKVDNDNRTEKALALALNCPFIKTNLNRAKGIIVNISGGPDLKQEEVHGAIKKIQSIAEPDSNIIYGTVINEELNGCIIITLIITGCDDSTIE